MKYLKKFNESKKDLEYKLDCELGENIDSYIDRLLDFYNELSKNKLAGYASVVSGKRSVVIGEFNGVDITIDRMTSKEDLKDYIKRNINKKNK